MDATQLIRLLGLRYRLLWAHARTGRGRALLFLVSWVLVMLSAGSVALGALGVSMAAIRLGHVRVVADALLGGLFLYAILAAALLGVGVEAAFSDAQLRRYPLNSTKRLVARHVTALLTPHWLLVPAMSAGLALGYTFLGIGRPWLSLPVAAMLVVADYLTARLLVVMLDRIRRVKIVAMAMVACGVLVAMAVPAFVMHADVRTIHQLAPAFRLSPPGMASTAITHPDPGAALLSAATLLIWILVLLGALLAFRRLPIVIGAAANRAGPWDELCDRVASVFSEHYRPLVAKNIRYYVRSAQLRLIAPTVILALPLVVWKAARHQADDPQVWFLASLAAFSCLGLGSGGLSLNLFGCDGPGFRRYFLVPIAPARVVLAAGLVGLVSGLSLVPVALLMWLLYAPGVTDMRMLGMLASSAVGGVLFYQGLGLWSSLLGPYRQSLDSGLGRTRSWAGNIVMMLSIYALVFLPELAVHLGRPLLKRWWLLPLFAVAGAVFFLTSAQIVGGLMANRRERILAAIERRTGSAHNLT